MKVFKIKKLLCIIIIKQMKKGDCRNLDIKIIANKTFLKTIKPFFFRQNCVNWKIISIDNGEVVPTERDTVYVLNTFFSVIVTSLKILEYYDPIANNISDPILKLIVIGITRAYSLWKKHATRHVNYIFHFRK